METVAKNLYKTNNKIIYYMPQLELKDIISAYIGQATGCMCGCTGTYYYNSKTRKEAEKDRGYKIDPKEVNDERINYILKMITARGVRKGIDVQDGYIYTLNLKTIRYIIYAKKTK